MNGAANVAEKKERLKRIFLNDGMSNNGIYGCQLYIMGVPTTVTIDDSIPLQNDNGQAIFAGISPDGAVWGPYLEKCFAKLHGNYETIISGDPTHSI